MKRILTAAVLIPLAVYLIVWSPWWAVAGVVALAACVSFHEYAGIAEKFGFGSLGVVGYAAGMWLLAERTDPLLAAVLIALGCMIFALSTPEMRHVLPRAALLFIGVIYIFGTWKCAILLRASSHWWLLFALALNWVGDVAAYYVGRRFGKHKLAPQTSPAKSWEGAVASLVFSVILGTVYLDRLLQVPLLSAILLSAAANVAGQFGDLCESAIKRGAGVKDSGTILPGHGGLLDRMDSSLFSMPVVYFYLRIFG